MKNAICICLSLLCCSLFESSLRAQQHSCSVVERILEEKLRIPYSELLRAHAAATPEERRAILQQALLMNTSKTPSALQNEKQGEIIQAFVNKQVTLGSEEESELHAAINPTDTNNIVCSGMSTSNGSLYFPLYYTKDFGNTWKVSDFSASPKEQSTFVIGGGDPMFAFDAKGKAYFSWIDLFIGLSSAVPQMQMYWASSTDGGANWDRNKDNDTICSGFLSLASQEESILPDKQWMACDQSQSSGRNNLYTSLLQYYPKDQRVAMRVKNADAPAFTVAPLRPKSTAYTFNQFTSIDCDDQGIVHMSFVGALKEDDMPTGHFRIYHLMSKDAGKSVEQENLVSSIRFLNSSVGSPTTTEPPTGMTRVQCLPQIACDKSSTSDNKGNVYVVWSAVGVSSRETNGLDIYLSRSTDHGLTWSTPVIVNDDPRGKGTTQAYASMTVSPDGVVIISWYDFREDPNNKEGKYYMTYSFDGGKTFIKNFAVSSSASDFSLFDSDAQKAFGMGEYNQVVATKNFAIPFWGDVRSGARQIYCAKIPINKDPELTSVQSLSSVSEGIVVEAPQPAPANASATMSYRLSSPRTVHIDLIDEQGKVVREIFNGTSVEGPSQLSIDCSDLASTLYYVRFRTEGTLLVHRLIVAH